MYLPQYHVIPENSKFWGEGFTDWVTVKKASPLFDGHSQPLEPYDDNYYDLSEKKNIQWQADLAKKYWVYGFGIYHYWYSKYREIVFNYADTFPKKYITDNLGYVTTDIETIFEIGAKYMDDQIAFENLQFENNNVILDSGVSEIE